MKKYSWLYRNSLSVVFIGLFVFTLILQAVFGWQEHNSELEDHGRKGLAFSQYLETGHFI